jgi:hypothetical protein
VRETVLGGGQHCLAALLKTELVEVPGFRISLVRRTRVRGMVEAETSSGLLKFYINNYVTIILLEEFRDNERTS